MSLKAYFMPYNLSNVPKYANSFTNPYFHFILAHPDNLGCLVLTDTDLLTHLSLLLYSDVRSTGDNFDRVPEPLLEKPGLATGLDNLDFNSGQILGSNLTYRKIIRRAVITCLMAEWMYFVNNGGYDMLVIDYLDNMNFYSAGAKQAFLDACIAFGMPQPDFSQNPTLLSALLDIADAYDNNPIVISQLGISI